jgi:hypothetical protein
VTAGWAHLDDVVSAVRYDDVCAAFIYSTLHLGRLAWRCCWALLLLLLLRLLFLARAIMLLHTTKSCKD